MAVAVPQYMADYLKLASPAQRFNLSLNLWNENWKKVKEANTVELEKCLQYSKSDKNLTRELIARQTSLTLDTEQYYSCYAKSISPLMTGMGIDHPLENGFSFLKPYGLPYLPGSSVKGVLRTAAEELALGFDETNHDWDMMDVWMLFGFDNDSSYLNSAIDSDPDIIQQESIRRNEIFNNWIKSSGNDSSKFEFLKQRIGYIDLTFQQFVEKIQSSEISIQGALDCWDVYVDTGKLDLDILTPHQTHYYHNNEPPHDCAQPIPNPFLVIPIHSGFNFHLKIKKQYLTDEMTASLTEKMDKLFSYTFNWLGFGGKTSLGYGVMEVDTVQLEKLTELRMARELESLTDEEKAVKKLVETEDREVALNQMEILINLDQISHESHQLMKDKIEIFWKGILNDPDKMFGRRMDKPRYKGRSKNIAKKLLER